MTTPQSLLFATVGILSFLSGGCSKPPAPPPQQAAPQTGSSAPLATAPEVTSENEEGFHDLVLYIREHKRLSDGSQSISAVGMHKGCQLGLEVVLGPTWQPGSLGKDIPGATYRGVVQYRSTGTASDTFVKVLDELYGTKLAPKAMNTETCFTGISLEGDPRDLAQGPVKIKLFFESVGQDDYAELFTDIELATRRLEICEKDEGYGLPVVKALQRH